LKKPREEEGRSVGKRKARKGGGGNEKEESRRGKTSWDISMYQEISRRRENAWRT